MERLASFSTAALSRTSSIFVSRIVQLKNSLPYIIPLSTSKKSGFENGPRIIPYKRLCRHAIVIAASQHKIPRNLNDYQQLTYVSPAAAKVIGKGQPSQKEDGAGNAIGNATAPHVRAAEHAAPALVISKERGRVRIDKILVPGLRIMDAGHAAVIGLNWHYFFLRCLWPFE